MKRSNLNPSQFMLDSFKRKLGADYDKMFLNSLSKELKMQKLIGFCYGLVSMMELKGYECSMHLTEDSVTIIKGSTVYNTYHLDLIDNISTEQKLKFSFMIEWGVLLKFTERKQLLIAL